MPTGALTRQCYGRYMPKRQLPRIYCDVHIKPGAIKGFRKQRFTCVRIPESKYRDLDEHDFYPHLYAENALLATGDLNFVAAYIETEGKHAWRRRFIYVHHDGVTIDRNTEEEHFHSWESLQ